MKYLIIGVTSLFGPTLYHRLNTKYPDAEIYTTSLEGDDLRNIPSSNNRVVDLTSKESIEKVIKEIEPDVVYDLAVQNSVGYAWNNPQETIDINVNGTLNLLDAIRMLEKKVRVVIAGSGEEYGELEFSQLPIAEKVKPNPRNIFAASKACQTMMAQLYAKAYKMDIVILRTFNEIGPGQSDRFAVSNFCHQFARLKNGQGETKIVVGNINIKRDFTDVRDLVEAFIMVESKGKSGEVYNAGRGCAVPVGRVLDILMEKTGIEVELVADAGRIRPIDPTVLESDNSKIKKDTGWMPKYSLEDTIEDMLEYWECVEKNN